MVHDQELGYLIFFDPLVCKWYGIAVTKTSIGTSTVIQITMGNKVVTFRAFINLLVFPGQNVF